MQQSYHHSTPSEQKTTVARATKEMAGNRAAPSSTHVPLRGHEERDDGVGFRSLAEGKDGV